MPEEFDIDNASLFLILYSFGVLTGKEIEYLMWRFGSDKLYSDIVKLDGRTITNQAVQYVVTNAIKKLRNKWDTSPLLREEIRLNYI